MENQKWDIKEFRKLIKQRLTLEYRQRIEISLEAIIWKNNLCKYHIEEYKRIIQQSNKDDRDQPIQTIGKILHIAVRTNEGKDYFLERFMAEAHVIAFAQALHSFADIIAHVVYFGLRMDSLKQTEISLNTVHRSTEINDIAPNVIEQISAFKKSNEFQYLQGFVNVTKHRSLIPIVHFVDFNDEKNGLRLGEFFYKSRDPFPMKWVDEFVGADYKNLLTLVQGIGGALNESLLKRDI